MASQLYLSPQERSAIVRPPAHVPEVHRLIMLHPDTQRLILQILEE